MSVFVETRGQGPSLTLLHGLGLNGAVWDSMADALAPYFTLHIVDLAGHGQSAHVAVTTLDAMADAIAHVMPARTHVLGWSLGGQVALRVALRHAGRVEKLILTATTPRFLDAPDWPNGKPHAVFDDFARRLAGDYAKTIREFLALQMLKQPNARAIVHALQARVSARGVPGAAHLQASLAVLRSSDLRAELSSIAHQALVIQGGRDALTAEPAARAMATAIPRARYALIPDAAHAPFLSHESEFIQHVRTFLS